MPGHGLDNAARTAKHRTVLLLLICRTISSCEITSYVNGIALWRRMVNASRHICSCLGCIWKASSLLIIASSTLKRLLELRYLQCLQLAAQPMDHCWHPSAHKTSLSHPFWAEMLHILPKVFSSCVCLVFHQDSSATPYLYLPCT